MPSRRLAGTRTFRLPCRRWGHPAQPGPPSCSRLGKPLQSMKRTGKRNNQELTTSSSVGRACEKGCKIKLSRPRAEKGGSVSTTMTAPHGKEGKTPSTAPALPHRPQAAGAGRTPGLAPGGPKQLPLGTRRTLKWGLSPSQRGKASGRASPA